MFRGPSFQRKSTVIRVICGPSSSAEIHLGKLFQHPPPSRTHESRRFHRPHTTWWRMHLPKLRLRAVPCKLHSMPHPQMPTMRISSDRSSVLERFFSLGNNSTELELTLGDEKKKGEKKEKRRRGVLLLIEPDGLDRIDSELSLLFLFPGALLKDNHRRADHHQNRDHHHE